MVGSRTQPLNGVAIQTSSAPLLGLQHVATVPSDISQSLGFQAYSSNSQVKLADQFAT